MGGVGVRVDDEIQRGFQQMYHPPPWRWIGAAAGAIVIALMVGTFLFISRQDLADSRKEADGLERQLQTAREQGVALETEIADLEDGLDVATEETATAEQATAQVERILDEARQCAYYLLGAVDAVDGAFGTENWSRFYTQIDRAFPHCERAAQEAGFEAF
jgi:cell division protein FtsB